MGLHYAIEKNKQGKDVRRYYNDIQEKDPATFLNLLSGADREDMQGPTIMSPNLASTPTPTPTTSAAAINSASQNQGPQTITPGGKVEAFNNNTASYGGGSRTNGGAGGFPTGTWRGGGSPGTVESNGAPYDPLTGGVIRGLFSTAKNLYETVSQNETDDEEKKLRQKQGDADNIVADQNIADANIKKTKVEGEAEASAAGFEGASVTARKDNAGKDYKTYIDNTTVNKRARQNITDYNRTILTNRQDRRWGKFGAGIADDAVKFGLDGFQNNWFGKK